MSIILGIDPGSRVTGFGVIDTSNKTARYIASGCVRVKIDLPVDQRLQQIYSGIEEVIERYQPTLGAIEQVFVHHNASSALKLGQARGVAMVAMANHGLPVSEYSARQIKQSVVGYGAAEKPQVQQMVKTLLQLSDIPQADAADALAIALCHFHTSQSLLGISGVKRVARGRLQ